MRTKSGRDQDLQLISWIQRSDPLGDHPEGGWSNSAEATAILRRIVLTESSSDVTSKIRGPRRPRLKRFGIIAVALLVIGAGVAGAKTLFGGPAPQGVKEDLASVDQGMPPDLRYNPDVQHAQLVAQADGARLYYATLADGGYCTEIVTPDSRAAGAVCTPSGSLASEPIGVTIPFVDPVTTYSPIIVGGRVNARGAVSLEAVFNDGSRQAVPMGDTSFFVFAVADEHLSQAHEDGMTLSATDANGEQVASTVVPGTDFSNPERQDAKQPIFVSTISTESDLTKVLGIEGSVNVGGAVALQLSYPDGTTVDIPLTAGGRYHYDLPANRVDDLFPSPGWLTALDAAGKELARTPVAAVAYWRS